MYVMQFYILYFIKIIILFLILHKIPRANKFHANSVPIYVNVPQYFAVNAAEYTALHEIP